MKALYAGRCSICAGPFAKGEEINYQRELKKASHVYCFAQPVDEIQPEVLAQRLGYRHYDWNELVSRMNPKT